MSKFSVGVVGLGWAASGHIPAFINNPDCEITAFCSSKDLSQDEVACMAGNPAAKLYHDYDEFLKHPGLQVVDLCTPHNMHAPQAIKAAEADKHLLIEKPLATTYEDLLAIRDVVKKTGVSSSVFFELRFIPHMTLVKSLVGQGLLGRVHHLEVDYYHGIGPWYAQHPWNVKKEIGVSSLITAGCHALDSLLFFADSEVEEVFAYSNKSAADWAQDYEYDSTSVSLLKFANGTIGKCVSCVDCRQPYVFNVHLVGSEGTLLGTKLSSTKIKGVNKEEWIEIPTAEATSGDVLDHPYPPQIDAFMSALKEGKDDVINVADAFKTFRVIFAIEKSLAEGRPVKVSELPA
ncbi:MAG: Gfo/Idh/MocA family oxidoreductase [Armatimonadia bacterium]